MTLEGSIHSLSGQEGARRALLTLRTCVGTGLEEWGAGGSVGACRGGGVGSS